MSLVVAMFNSYPELFIVMFLTALTRLSDFSIFSLVNIAFKFSFCELDALLNVSAVRLIASVIDNSSSSLMNLNTASQIFTLYNGILMLSLKLVMVLISSV